MDSVTGPQASDVVEPGHGFEAPAGPIPRGRRDRRRALGAAAIVVAIGLVGLAAGLAGGDDPRLPAAASPAPPETVAAGLADAARSGAQGSGLGAPIALLSTRAGIRPARQAIVAIPGCDFTLQLSSRQPRWIHQCAERLPSELGQMLRVGPGAPLQLEVPGWQVQLRWPPFQLASEPGMSTVAVPACLSRDTERLCATWYATVDVRS